MKGFSGAFLGTKTLPAKRLDLQIAKRKNKSLYYEQQVNQIKKEKQLADPERQPSPGLHLSCVIGP